MDGRNTEAEGVGAMSLRFNRLLPEGGLGDEMLVDLRVCDCCQTALVNMSDGTIVAAYRDRSPEEIRDIAVKRLVDGEWSEVYHVGSDNWHMRACPVNGPSLSTEGERVAIVWFSAPDGDNRVAVAFSSDKAQTFGSPIRVDDGNPLGRADIEFLPDGSALAVWLERVGEEAEVRARRITAGGDIGESWTVTETSQSRRSGFPRMVRAGDELIFAWTLVGDDGGIRVATARIH